jgi:hypothetical protein
MNSTSPRALARTDRGLYVSFYEARAELLADLNAPPEGNPHLQAATGWCSVFARACDAIPILRYRPFGYPEGRIDSAPEGRAVKAPLQRSREQRQRLVCAETVFLTNCPAARYAAFRDCARGLLGWRLGAETLFKVSCVCVVLTSARSTTSASATMPSNCPDSLTTVTRRI